MFNPDLKKLLKDCNSRYSLVVGVAKEHAKSEMRQLRMKYCLMKNVFLLQLTISMTESS